MRISLFRKNLNIIISITLIILFSFFLIFTARKSNVTIKEIDPPLSSEILFTTKWAMPTSTNTSAIYTEFATRVKNNGTIKYAEIYYVLTKDSTLTAHIMDEDLNIVATSDSVFTEAGSGLQTFSFPEYTYSGDNMYVALESDSQTIGLGTVQEISSVSSCVTSDNRQSGIQNAQKWATSSTLKKVDGSTQYGLSLYIQAYGELYSENTEATNEETPEVVTLFTTKWEEPTSTLTNVTYSGFATRVVNQGHITSLDIYYVLTEDSNLTASILDTDLNYIISSSEVATPQGVGYLHFDIPDYEYNYTEMYIAVESNKKSLGLGTIQDIAYVSQCVTSDNRVSGMQNASKFSVDKPLAKVNGSTQKGLSLYIKAYGYENTETLVEAGTGEVIESDMAIDESELLDSKLETTKTNSRVSPDTHNTVYISSKGSDKATSGSESSPYKTLSYAIKQKGSNTTYCLKCGDTFSMRYGINISNLSNVRITSYGDGAQPILSGLLSFTAKLSGSQLVGTLSEKDMGVLLLDNNSFWKRKTKNSDISDPNSYYLDPSTKAISINYNKPVSSARFAAPYCGMIISGCHNFVVEDIELCYYGLHGIQVTYNSSNVGIYDCTIHHIGGAMSGNVKLGNGIELWLANINDIYVENNEVYDCFDAGITAQISGDKVYTNKNIVFDSNTATNCRYNFEYFNATSTSSICEVFVRNNILNNCIDITEGYRETAGTSYGAFLCLWRSNGDNDMVIIENNTCTNSDASCVSYKENNNGKIILNNNSFSSYQKQVLNSKYLYGTGNSF